MRGTSTRMGITLGESAVTQDGTLADSGQELAKT